jgi:Leucine-rich repeat (LRR) protein
VQFDVVRPVTETMKVCIASLCIIFAIFVEAISGFEGRNFRLQHSGTLNIPASEYNALKDLYDATNGKFWDWGNLPGNKWNFTGSTQQNPCADDWAGVVCSNCTTSCNVIVLTLQTVNLTGTLSPSIGSFPALTSLSLNVNNLFGSIPTQVGLLTSLVQMDLSYNSLEGSIPPSMCYLNRTMILQLQSNALEGPIPYCIGNWTDLVQLRLASNSLSQSIPSTIGDLTNIQSVDLHANSLTGTLPATMTRLSNLRLLAVYSNSLHGALGLSYAAPYWASLLVLEIDGNFFSSTLPTYMGNWSKLATFYAGSNFIKGSIPETVQHMKALQQLSLDSNELTSSIPTQLTGLDRLTSISIQDNYLEGSIPSQLCMNMVLTAIGLDGNELSGSIPDCLWTLDGLTGLNVTANSLTGSIPSFLALDGIITLYLSDNYFSGSMPDMTGMDSLKFLDFSNNSFSGPLTNFGVISSLETLLVSNNMFSGSLDELVSDEFGHSLTSIDVSNNKLVGSIPSAMFGSSLLQDFAAINNCFSGSIPSSICLSSSLSIIMMDGLSSNCRSSFVPHISKTYILAERVSLSSDVFQCMMEFPDIEAIYYAGNSVQLKFPDMAIISSKVFTTLSMTHNQMAGTVPLYVFNNTWELLDLSYNRLTGVLAPIHLANNQSSVALEVNRFSGVIPGSYVNLNNVNILQDNMFSCGLVSEKGLPTNDPQAVRQNYSCGSDSLNQALVAWGVVFLIILILVHYAVGIRVLIRRVKEMVPFTDFEKETNRGSVQLINHSLEIFEEQQSAIRRNVLLCLGTIMGVFFPLYCVLSKTYSIFTYKYGWYPSALFNSGVVPAIVLLVFLSLFLVQVHYLFREEDESVTNAPRTSNVDRGSWFMTVRNGVKFVTKRYFLNWRAILVLVLDIILIGGATAGYIFVTVRASHQAAVVASVFVALLKALWNGPILKALIEALRVREQEWKHDSISHTTSKPVLHVFDDAQKEPNSDESIRPTDVRPPGVDIDVEMTNSPFAENSIVDDMNSKHQSLNALHIPNRESIESWKRQISSMLSHTTLKMLDFDDTYHRDLRFRLYLGFLNSIVLPCVTTAFVSTSCFSALLESNTSITGSYSTVVCSAALADTNCVPAVANSTVVVGSTTTEYLSSAAPFVYSYQCASIVLKSFAPVFISSAIISGFMFPLMCVIVDKVLVVHHVYLSTACPILRRSLEILHFLLSFTKSHSRTIRMIQDLKDHENGSLVTHGSIFRKDVHLALIINNIAELVTFGVLMPLVGIVVAISIMTQTWIANRRVGELLLLFKEHDFYLGIDLMGRECASLPQTISNSIVTITFIASGFWCFLAFDQYGDDVGFHEAAFILLWLFYPLMIPDIITYARGRAKSGFWVVRGERNRNDNDKSMQVVEMQSTIKH